MPKGPFNRNQPIHIPTSWVCWLKRTDTGNTSRFPQPPPRHTPAHLKFICIHTRCMCEDTGGTLLSEILYTHDVTFGAGLFHSPRKPRRCFITRDMKSVLCHTYPQCFRVNWPVFFLVSANFPAPTLPTLWKIRFWSFRLSLVRISLPFRTKPYGRNDHLNVLLIWWLLPQLSVDSPVSAFCRCLQWKSVPNLFMDEMLIHFIIHPQVTFMLTSSSRPHSMDAVSKKRKLPSKMIHYMMGIKGMMA